MAQVYIADLLPGAQVRAFTWLTTLGNPEGNWGNAYQLAHQDGSSVELVCDFHAKRRRRLPDGSVRFEYLVTVTNAGPTVAPVYIDW